jgi:hypothetical protein
MDEKNGKLVTLRPKGNKEGLEAEPEMIGLKGMVQTGQVDWDRTVFYLDANAEADEKGDPRSNGRGVGALLPVQKLLISLIRYDIEKAS